MLAGSSSSSSSNNNNNNNNNGDLEEVLVGRELEVEVGEVDDEEQDRRRARERQLPAIKRQFIMIIIIV